MYAHTRAVRLTRRRSSTITPAGITWHGCAAPRKNSRRIVRRSDCGGLGGTLNARARASSLVTVYDFLFYYDFGGQLSLLNPMRAQTASELINILERREQTPFRFYLKCQNACERVQVRSDKHFSNTARRDSTIFARGFDFVNARERGENGKKS